MFAVTGPSGVTDVPSTTGANGLASASFTPSLQGAYQVVASFAGNAADASSSSSSPSISVYQDTQLSVSSVTAVAGAQTMVSAKLLAEPSNTPLAGQTVQITPGGEASACSAITDSTGVASCTVTYAAAGSFTASASFENLVGFFANESGALAPEVASAPVVVSLVTTSISGPSAPTMASVGQSVTVSAVLSGSGGGLSGEPVVFVITDPSHGVTDVSSITGVGGSASASFTPSLQGAYQVVASFAGSAADASSSSSALSISVYQDTQLSVSSVNTVAGVPTVVSARLLAEPGGAPVSGQAVEITPGGGLAPCLVITDSNGFASCMVTYPAAGAFTATASFENLAGFFANEFGAPAPEVASAPVDISLAPTSISVPVVPGMASVGNEVSVSASLSGAGGGLSGEPVVFAVTGPSGVTDVPSTTGANGLASASFTPSLQGAYQVVASFAGNAADASSSSSSPSISVYQDTQLSVSSVTAVAGAQTMVSAKLLAEPSNTPLAGQTVQITPGGEASACSAITDSTGVASCTVTYAAAGSFTASASFENLAGFFANESGALAPEVASAPVVVSLVTTSISGPSAPTMASVGQSVTVSAVLSGSGGGLSGEPVVFVITDPSHGVTDVSSITGVGGSASASFTPSLQGAYQVVASFAGSAADASSSSSALSISVYQDTQLSVPSVNTVAGVPTVVSARLLAEPGGAPVSGQAVEITPGGGLAPCLVITDSNGFASCMVTYPAAGAFTATASFENLAGFFANEFGAPAPEVASAPVDISLAPTSISVPVVPGMASVGNEVSVSASLSGAGGGLSGEPVVFAVTGPSGVTDVPSTTGSTGLASASFTPSQRGLYRLSRVSRGTRRMLRVRARRRRSRFIRTRSCRCRA